MTLQVDHVAKEYPTRSGPLSILRDINLSLARGLINPPLLLLADEPTGTLDRHTARTVGRLLLDLHQQEQTVLVVVTHSQELAEMFPRTLLMDDGSLRPGEAGAGRTGQQTG